MTVSEAARVNMIESQLRPNKVTDERAIASFVLYPMPSRYAFSSAARW